MKRILLTLITVASVANAKDVDERTFLSGVHLGMTIVEAAEFYRPGTPGAIANAGSTSWGGAPTGQQYLDFRNQGPGATPGTVHEWRVLVCYRESDGKIVLIDYWNFGITKEQMSYLTDLNRPYGPLVTRLNNPDEFIVTTPEQDKLEQQAIRPL